MIKQISIKNFKCFKNNNFPCQNLNLLTGLNGMGKSSLIQLLLILRQSFFNNSFNTIILNGDYVDIGAFEDAIYQDFEKESPYIEIKVAFSKINAFWQTISYYDNENDSIVLFCKTKNVDVGLYTESLFSYNNFQFIQAERVGPRDTLPANNMKLDTKDFGKDGSFAMHYFIINRGNEIPISKLAHPSEQSLILELQINAWLNEISPNVRIKSVFHQTDKTKIIPLFGYYGVDFERKPFKAKNIGFGVSYIFSVILSLLTAKPNDLIIIENPESHLHPKGQTKLAELASIAAQNGVQVFLETHSDHILNGVRISAKKYQRNSDWGINNENINIFYFDRNKETLESKITQIKLDKNSKLYSIGDNGASVNLPKGFFDELGISVAQLI